MTLPAQLVTHVVPCTSGLSLTFHKACAVVVPLRFGVDPYGFMGKYQGIQCVNLNPQKMAGEIFSALVKNSLTGEKIQDSIIGYFEGTPSFAEARRRIDLLQHVKTWSPDRIQRIHQSLEKNSQIRNANGIPDRVRYIISRHES